MHESNPALSPLVEPALDDSPGAIGRITHTAIAALAATAETTHPDTLIDDILKLSHTLCPPNRVHRRNSTLVAGFTVEYLRGAVRPRSPWQFLAAEITVGDGRPDLIWQHRHTGAVFFDEVKTVNVARLVPDVPWLRQCRRYAAAGSDEFGEAFIGVRLLPLGSMNTASFINLDGSVRPLVPTWSDPLAAPEG